jgi:hypothetical protein
MPRLSFGFVLAYHGCDRQIAERLLKGEALQSSDNDYDWLGPGIYFWEANPMRGLEWARDQSKRKPAQIKNPYVVGAVIDLGNCLDLSTSWGIAMVRKAHAVLVESAHASQHELPINDANGFIRKLDCAVIRRVHTIVEESGRLESFDSVRGVFTEGPPAYAGAGFLEKTHIQISVRNVDCIKGVFRVPDNHLNL